MANFLHLPTELQRDILELAAILDPKGAVNLTVVSRVIQQWMECFLYHTVVLDFPLIRTKKFIQAINLKPPEFFAQTVRRLYLTDQVSSNQAKRILSVCTQLSSLICWVHPEPEAIETQVSEFLSLIPTTTTPTLTRLSVRIEILLQPNKDGSTYTLPDYEHPILRQLTHLEVVSPPGSFYLTAEDEDEDESSQNSGLRMLWESLIALRKLKHLSFGTVELRETNRHRDLIRSLPSLLEHSPSLKALVLITKDPKVEDSVKFLEDGRCHTISSFTHPKNLVTYWGDLSTEGYMGRDFWDVSDSDVHTM